MGRRKDNDMEKLQEMLEGFLEAMDSGKGLPGFIDPLDLADGEDVQVIDNVHIKVDGDLTGMDMLDNYDRFEISDIAADMLYPEVLPEKPRVKWLLGRIRDFILTRPERFLQMLPASVIDAMEEMLQVSQLSFDEWYDDLQSLEEAGFCRFGINGEVIIPGEYANLYSEKLQSPEIKKKLKYWRKLETEAVDIISDAQEEIALGDLAAQLAKTVKAGKEKDDRSKVLAFESPAVNADVIDEIRYVLMNRLTSWDSDIVAFEGDDDLYLGYMSWEDIMDSDWDDDDDWDEDEEFADDDWDEDDDGEDWDDDDWDDEYDDDDDLDIDLDEDDE